MLAHPDTLFGLGDGGAHVGLIADASFPTYFLSHWARDRSHGRMPVGQVVAAADERTTRGPSGLADRGVVAEGMKADLNVIDFDHVRCEFARHGLRPAGRRQAAAAGRPRVPRRRSWTGRSRIETASTPARCPVGSCGAGATRRRA